MNNIDKNIIFDAQSARKTRHNHYFDDLDGLGYTDRDLYEFLGGCFVHAYVDGKEAVLFRGTPQMADNYREHGQNLPEFIDAGTEVFGNPTLRILFVLCTKNGQEPLYTSVMVPADMMQEESDRQIAMAVRDYFGDYADIIGDLGDRGEILHELAESKRGGATDAELSERIRNIHTGPFVSGASKFKIQRIKPDETLEDI